MASQDNTPPAGTSSFKKCIKILRNESPERERESRRPVESAAATSSSTQDPLSASYGDVPLRNLQSLAITGRVWTDLERLNIDLKDKMVLIRGRLQMIRRVGKKRAFVVLRDQWHTVQCVLMVEEGLVSNEMIKYTTGLSRESILDVEGVVSVPDVPVRSVTQEVEIRVRKIYCISRAVQPLPVNIDDLLRSDEEIKEGGPRVNQDTRLNNRVIDLRTATNQSIFRLKFEVETLFRNFLVCNNFVGIHTPKLMEGCSEGGSAVFKLDYKGKPASLAQSPQIHKQLSIRSDFKRVFEVGSIFRAEDFFTHRHLCEYTGLDAEMEIREHYFEVMDLVERLFLHILESLDRDSVKHVEVIRRQYPFEPLRYNKETLRLTFEDGVRMLREAGLNVDPLGDLNTESERKLGQLVRETYNTDFYIVHRFPLAARPFFTMPCPDDPVYSNSFDVFLRGEEICSGGQRIHDPELLKARAKECGVDLSSMSAYLDSFRYGSPLHGGFGVGLERVVMLYCSLNNIRKTSLFPRDPKRLSP